MDFLDRDMEFTTPPLGGRRNLGIEAGLADVLRAARTAPPPPRTEPPGGAEDRYRARIERFARDGRTLPRLRHHALWMLHNCVAHPLLAVAGRKLSPLAVEFHELTSQWLNHVEPIRGRWDDMPNRTRVMRYRVPEVKKGSLWVLHNTAAHVAIGLWPCKATFDLHDWSARWMDVPGWA